jgi:hypothetical protein
MSISNPTISASIPALCHGARSHSSLNHYTLDIKGRKIDRVLEIVRTVSSGSLGRDLLHLSDKVQVRYFDLSRDCDVLVSCVLQPIL